MAKPSYKSTEFWVTLVGLVGGVVLGSMPDSPITNVAGALLAAICGGSYTLGRSMVKGQTAKSEGLKTSKAIGDALLSGLKKKV